MGDPAGIGPEVTEKALECFFADTPVEVSLFGPRNVLQNMTLLGKLPFPLHTKPLADFEGPMAEASAASGQAALNALMAGIGAAEAGEIDAIVTAPLSKQALVLAGSKDLGHTEILARHLGVGPTAMAFLTPRLKLVLCTVHIPLKQVFAALSAKRVVDCAQLLSDLLRRHDGRKTPRLALAGLNPHAGEGGILGDEEQMLLIPAAAQARALGLDLSDPLAPDTLFRRVVDGEFDGVVALYHDQGLIPVKLLSFGEAVNVTLGLRVPRTSPDHGTAYDRVGLGTARSDGMLAALQAAVNLARPHTGET